MSAVEEYRRWCEYTQPLSLVERGKAKAAIAELEAKLDTALALAALREGWAKKPEDVLSEVEALTAPLLERAERAEAENERLRVCGTCGHFTNAEYEMCDIPNEFSVDSEYVGAQDCCRFKPSRWTPYWEEPC